MDEDFSQEYRAAYSDAMADIVRLWEGYKGTGMSPEEIYQGMDIFFLAASMKLTGSSTEDAASVLTLLA